MGVPVTFTKKCVNTVFLDLMSFMTKMSLLLKYFYVLSGNCEKIASEWVHRTHLWVREVNLLCTKSVQ